jgi:hypothetical protein
MAAMCCPEGLLESLNARPLVERSLSWGSAASFSSLSSSSSSVSSSSSSSSMAPAMELEGSGCIYSRWKATVDAHMDRILGKAAQDLPDADWQELFAQGFTPRSAVHTTLGSPRLQSESHSSMQHSTMPPLDLLYSVLKAPTTLLGKGQSQPQSQPQSRSLSQALWQSHPRPPPQPPPPAPPPRPPPPPPQAPLPPVPPPPVNAAKAGKEARGQGDLAELLEHAAPDEGGAEEAEDDDGDGDDDDDEQTSSCHRGLLDDAQQAQQDVDEEAAAAARVLVRVEDEQSEDELEGKGVTFQQWKSSVDNYLEVSTGRGAEDLPDADWAQLYAQGFEPGHAADITMGSPRLRAASGEGSDMLQSMPPLSLLAESVAEVAAMSASPMAPMSPLQVLADTSANTANDSASPPRARSTLLGSEGGGSTGNNGGGEGNDGPAFGKWKLEVNTQLVGMLDIKGAEELPDVDWRDMYDQGVSPDAATQSALGTPRVSLWEEDKVERNFAAWVSSSKTNSRGGAGKGARTIGLVYRTTL